MSFLINSDILKSILTITCVAASVQTCLGQGSPPANSANQSFVTPSQQRAANDPFGEGDSLNDPNPPREEVSLQLLAELQSRTQQIISQSAPAIVAIDETGSGVIVSPSGIVLTASHVTRVAKRRVSVALSDGRIVQGVTLGSNIASDTGAIQLLAPGPYAYVSVKDSKGAAPGSWCIAMGYPLSFPRGKPATGRLGRVLSRSDNGKLITDCTIMGGDSGGPLLNLDGKVIGISSSVKLGIDQNLSIPSEQFIKDWKNIAMSIDKTSLQTNTQLPPDQKGNSNNGFRITKRPTGKAYLGINAETDQNIVRIRAVHRQSPAEFAGIQANDVIMKMDAIAITSFSQIVKYLKSKKPGDQVSVLINRYGSLLATEVNLGGTLPKK
ncbi:S1C family serine protease [bacterium]|nr:S1C family serine protease [bacterium]